MADGHHTVLGFEASQAINALTRLEQATVSYAAGIDIATGSILRYNRTARQTDNTLNKNAKSMGAVSQAMNEFGKTASKLPPSHPVSQALKTLDANAKQASQSLTLTWKSMARIFTIQALHGAISKLTSLLSESVEEARAFGIAIAEVETIAGPLGLTFNQLADQARGVAEAIGAPLDVVAEAQYQLYSNQVGNAVESTLALEAASKLSLAAVTSLNDSVAVVTGVMNSYGISAARAEEISAKLFRTVELGRVRAAELANTLGRTTVIAAQLGVSYEEVLASIATMTIQGQKASDAQTRLTQVMLKLIRPTDAMKDAFKDLGVVSAEAGIQAFGFQGFLEKLRGTTNGTVTEFATLFGRVRATAGALGITGKAADRYRENLEKINNTTTELLEQKVDIIMRTNAKQVEKELNSLQITVIEEFGRGMNELLGDLFRYFGGAVNTIKTLALSASVAGVAFLALRAQATAAATSTVTGMAAAAVATKGLLVSMRALALSPAGIALAVGAATALIVGYFTETQDEANKTLDLLDDFRDKELAAQLRAQDKAFKARQKQHKKIIAATQRFLMGIIKLRGEARERAADLEQRATDSLNAQLSDRTGALQTYVGSLINLADTLDSRLKKLDKSSDEVVRNIKEFQFGRQLRDLNNIQKVYALINRSQELRRQSTSALNKGERELAASLSEQSKDYSNQALQIADSTKNRALANKAEREVILSLGQQKTLNFGIANQEKGRAKLAEEQLRPLYSQLNLLDQLSKKLKENEFELKKGRKTEEEITAITAKRNKITGQIKNVLADIAKEAGIAEQLGLEDPFAQIVKQFREGITGKKMDLTDLVTFGNEAVIAARVVELEKSIKDKLKPILIALEVETPEAAAERLTQLPITMEAANEELEKNRVAASEVRRILLQMTINMAAFKAAIDDSNVSAEVLEATQTRYNTLVDKAAKAAFRLPTVGGAAALPEVQAGINQLEAWAAALAKAGQPEAAKVAADAAEKLQRAVAEFHKIHITTEGLKAEQQIRAVGGAMDDSATDSSSAATSINNDLTIITNNAIKAANALARVRLGTAGAAKTAAHGALFFNSGGFAPRGSDRIAAMLSQGESVNTADSTRRFASQIQAMNAGINPVFRDAGGSVSVGDVNISVKGAPTPQQTAREVLTAFKRELRRKTSSF